MDIRQLKYFIETVRLRNVSNAAKNLFITQSTLSTSLKKLEEEVGTELFYHQESPFKLTEAGQILYEGATHVVAEFDQLQNNLQHYLTRSGKEKLSIGITTLFAAQFMEQISQFILSHPEVELEIVQGGSRRLQRSLALEEIDIGLLSLPNYETDKIALDPLSTSIQGYNVYVIIPTNNPLSQRESITFAELKDQRFSSLNEDYMLGKLLPTRAHELGFDPHIVMYHEDVQNMLLGLYQSQSICLIPIEYQEYINPPNLAWIPLDDRNNYYPIGIAIRKHSQPTQSMLDLIDIIKKK